MKKREIGNTILHIVLASSLTALVMWHVLFINLAVFVYAALREQAQHRWILEHRVAKPMFNWDLYSIEKRTFFDFGWLGKQQAWEIAQALIGSAVVSIPWYFFG
jgi:hypothetical protein